jgi:tetratricopeptide (TPR) repeat protein
VFHYRPERIVIYYPPEGEAKEFAVDIGGEIGCKACGSPVDRLGLTSFGQFQLMSSTLPNLSYVTVQNDVQILGENKECEKQVLVCPQGQEVLGEPVETMSQGLERYDRLLANDPENTGFLVGKANLLFRLLRLRETEAYYRRVLEGDPSCLDALVGLFDLCRRQGREEEAWDWLQQAHDLLHRGNVVRGDKNDLQERIRQIYAREASRRGMAPEQPLRSRKHRVRRNDPCPCGSGKKYKKCCLDK